jgi:hypothetical protein
MSLWQLLKDNPDWVGVVASSIFAAVTACIIFWQVCVMIWQGRNSDRHERAQNRLIRLQHEHEWVWRRNRERDQLLKLGRELHLAVGCLVDQSPDSLEPQFWGEIQDAVHELTRRLNVLDIAAFSGDYDQWFPALEDYVSAIDKIVIDEKDVQYPSKQTKKKLEDAEKHHKPLSIFLDIEAAIRMDFFDFKNKWDAETSNV